MYLDSHTHLNDETLYDNWKDHIREFEQLGGIGLINVGADSTFNKLAIEIAQQSTHIFPSLYIKASVGFHPYEIVVGNINSHNIDQMVSNLKQSVLKHKNDIVAIGEAGIDLHYKDSGLALSLQQELFDRQCRLAQELELPLIIHSRDAFDETLDIVKRYANIKIYFHCRGYGAEELEILQSKFKYLWVGFCGNITYKKADSLRDSLANVDRNKILLETDAPYLTPQILRGEKNKPQNIVHIYQYVAEQLKIDIEDLQKQVKDNFENLYMK